MKILLTGSDGYIGSMLAPILLKDGHEITGLDSGFYKSGCLYHKNCDQPRTIVKDIRNITLEEIHGYDVVIHMAELSNDPTGELSPSITLKINHQGSLRLARLAKEAGIRRFIYMSSCSVYGIANGDIALSEESRTMPQTAYAICKTLCERDLIPLASPDFSPIIFRNATVFGPSPRQRFDLVFNYLCGLAWTKRRIELTSNGKPWRPLIHISDLANAVICAIHAPIEAIHGEIFNVGSNSLNFKIEEIAEIISKEFLECETIFGSLQNDSRSYKVDFDKIHTHMPNFHCKWNLHQGARQFHDLFKQIEFTEGDLDNRCFTRLKQLTYLLRTNQIDEEFFWLN